MASSSSPITRDAAPAPSNVHSDAGSHHGHHDSDNPSNARADTIDVTSSRHSQPLIDSLQSFSSKDSSGYGITSYDGRGDEEEWEDVTEAFSKARKVMSIGEMIHSTKFTLLSAMSAIELMDPKMDVGCGPVRDLNEIKIPSSLTHFQVIHIMDRLFALEMSWLNSHTLAQTVFSCVFVHRLHEIPRSDLFLFARLQLASMHTVSNVITEEKVADEEDFVHWTFGFRLPQMECRRSTNELEQLNGMLEQAVSDIKQTDGNDDNETQLIQAILLRLKLRVAYYYSLRCLAGQYTHLSPFDALSSIKILQQLTEQWIACPYRLGNCLDKQVDYDLLNLVFDFSINRHLMTSTPPRTADVFDIDAGLNYFNRMLTQLVALTELRKRALPPDIQLSSTSSSTRPAPIFRYSLHVAIHAFESYCSMYHPCVLTRAFMSRLMLMVPGRSSFMFDNVNATFSQMIATDMGISIGQLKANTDAISKYAIGANPSPVGENQEKVDSENSSGEGDDVLESMRDAVVSVFECFFRNRSRQRRQMLRSLRWWDHCAYITTNPNGSSSRKDSNSATDYTASAFDDDDDDSFSGHLVASTESKTLTPNVIPSDNNNLPNGSNEDTSNTKDYANNSTPRRTSDPFNRDITHSKSNTNEESRPSSGTVFQTLEGKTPLQLVAYEVCCRLMVQHWLLGLECELYHDFEYGAIFFYIGYVLSNLSNATTALAQCGLKNAQLHPLRFVLHLMDEARLWICRALFLLIGALSSGKHWDYTYQRDNIYKNKKRHNKHHRMYGSEELWYEQRFGVVKSLINGPPYANYSSFLAFSKMQCESLLDQANSSQEKDLVALRLKEASALFVVARRKLENAKKFAAEHDLHPATGQNYLVDEILKLGRVTVENSLSATQILRDYLHDRKISAKKMPEYSVNFVLSRHPHFPVVKVAEKT